MIQILISKWCNTTTNPFDLFPPLILFYQPMILSSIKVKLIKKKNSFRFKENIYYTKVTYWQKTPLRQALTKRGSNRISFSKVVLGSVKFTVFLWTENSVMASMNEAWFIYDRSGRLAQCIRPLRSQDTINLSFKFVKTCPTLISSEVNSTDTFQNKD